MIGTRPTKFQNLLVDFSDKIRYSKLWPFQRVFDTLQLCHFNFKLPNVDVSSETLSVEVPEGLRYLGVKLLASLDYLDSQNYDLVYKTTLSSLVNPELFVDAINKVPLDEPVYAGTRIRFPGKVFVSGANLLLNNKSIKLMLSKRYLWNHGDLDDVAVSNLLRGIEITELASLNISSAVEANQLSPGEIRDTLHYRCKTAGPNRQDIEVMRTLLKRIQNKS